MASAFLTLVTGALLLLCFYLYLKYTHWKRNGIPCSKGWYPIIGHFLPLITKKQSYSEVIEQLYHDYSNHSMVGMYKGTKPVLVLRDIELIKTVLQSNFSKFHENAVKIDPKLDPLLAKNPFFCYGELWQTGRKRLTYAFSNARLKILFAAVNEVCTKFQNFLNKQLQSSKKYEVELKSLFLKFTSEVVANAGLGIEGFCFEDDEVKSMFTNLDNNDFLDTFLVGIIMHFPFLTKLLKIKFLPQKHDRFFRTVVRKNLELRRSDPIPRNDFIQLMIDMEQTGEKIDEESVAAHAVSFYLDGVETSSVTLNFIGCQLAIHQDVQEKLRKEVRSTIEKHGGVLTFEAIKDMTYMNQVINESQRCFSALGFLGKICTDEFELQGSDGLNYRAKPGTEIVIPICGLHKDPKYWDNPEIFDPERFSDENKKNIEKMAFLPFGEGPRICVGMRMAMLQMKSCLATLMKDYKLEVSPKMQLPLRLSPNYFLSAPLGGGWVLISEA